MTKRCGFLRAAGVLSLLVVAAAPARAQIVYDNGLPSTNTGDEMTGSIQAEDFFLAVITNITKVRFWGIEVAELPDYTGSIFWQIIANAGVPPAGSPFGPALESGSATPAETPYAVDLGFTGRQLEFDVNFTLPTGIYWLALHNGDPTVNTSPTGFGFYWAETTGPSDPLWVSSSSPGHQDDFDDPGPGFDGVWVSNGREHAFQLEGSVVPEPASMALLATGLVGLAGVGLLRRRRKDG